MKTHIKQTIPIGRYQNTQILDGYIEADPLYRSGSVLYPYRREHDTILSDIKSWKTSQVGVSHHWIRMPAKIDKTISPNDYRLVVNPESLRTTLTSIWYLKKDEIQKSWSDFTIRDNQIQNLQSYMDGLSRHTFIINGGYFVTPNLLLDKENAREWSFGRRFPEYALPEKISPFYGFYYHNHRGRVHSTFQDLTHRGAIGIDGRGNPHLISKLVISKYQLKIGTQTLTLPHPQIERISPSDHTSQSQEIAKDIKASYWMSDSWKTYAEEIVGDKIFVWIANRGQGRYPQDEVFAVWKERAPRVNFGTILAFEKEAFAEYANSLVVGMRVEIVPELPEEYRDYTSIYTLSVPLLVKGQLGPQSLTPAGVMEYVDSCNLTHPNFQLSQESIVFSPYIRVPSHIIWESENYIGGMLCSGRYELSLGASLVDEVNLLSLLSDKGSFPERIETAIKLDGGSGAKFAQKTDQGIRFHNLVAPGSRNAFGDGNSNFYHGVGFELK